MAKFNTHGGYFAPTGYFRVDTGGSHEENPNGGVQVGVDPEGTPNLLEEGEPVYNDYVYSDNITADEEILKKYKIPAKFAGKLYSVIADAFVDEAEERPLDPVSNNGLNAMLVRLADAQEEQKQIQQQKELEEELANLSPEELDELEHMLSQQEALEAQQAQPSPEEQIAMEQQMQAVSQEQAPMMQMPMMANGGFIKKFEYGTPGEVEEEKPRITDVSSYLRGIEDLSNEPTAADVVLEDLRATGYDGQPHINMGKINSGSGSIEFLNPGSLAGIPGLISRGASIASRGAQAAEEAKVSKYIAAASKKARNLSLATKKSLSANVKEEARSLDKLIKEGNRLNKRGKYSEAETVFSEATEAARDLKHDRRALSRVSRDAKSPNPRGYYYENGILETEEGIPYIKDQWNRVRPFVFGVPALGVATVPVSSDVRTDEENSQSQKKAQSTDQDDVTWAMGGKMNRYPGGGWVNFLNALNEYKVSRNPGGIRGTYRIDTRFPLSSGVDSIKALEDSDYYKGFTDYVLANPTDPNVQSYLKALDEGTASDVAKLFNGEALVDNWQDIYRKRRYDQKGGIYHFNPTSLDDLNSIIAANNNAPVVPEVPKQNIADTILADYNNRTIEDPRVSEPEVDAAINAYKSSSKGPWTASSSSSGVTPLATFPRYAGAISSGIMGVYNAFQEPDRYDLGYYNPVLPTGQMDLVDPVYNPLDQNMAIQTLLASSAGTNRALQNSGLGPSTGAALLASDYNTGRNLGNTFTTVWDANNQRLNNIIAQRNQNASTLGNFNYGINRERAHILNQAALTNLRNSYLQQRLNYEAEAQKYAAIQNQLDNVNKALAGIGRENTYLNQINFDNAYDYAAAPNGVSMYAPWYAKCGGFIKKYKK